jgi:hypothetical protein
MMPILLSPMIIILKPNFKTSYTYFGMTARATIPHAATSACLTNLLLFFVLQELILKLKEEKRWHVETA